MAGAGADRHAGRVTTTIATSPAAPGSQARLAHPSAHQARQPARPRGQVVVDGAYLLPRTVLATRRLLQGQGIEAYRATFPDAVTGRTRTSPARVATHVTVGFLLGLATLAVVALVVAALLASPLLLAPAGVAGVGGLAALGAAHDGLTRCLVDRLPR